MTKGGRIGRCTNMRYKQASSSFRRINHSPGRGPGASKSRRIPCSGWWSGIKAVWKVNKISGDLKSASVHNSYTEFCKRLKTKDGSPSWTPLELSASAPLQRVGTCCLG